MDQWPLERLKKLDLLDASSEQEIFNATDNISSSMAPDHRKSWRLLLILEGLAIILPLAWFMGINQQWSPSLIASGVLIFTLFMVAFIWWTRWRSMKTNWIQLRLLAEITRSFIYTKPLSTQLTGKVLEDYDDLKAFTDHLESLPQQDSTASDKDRISAYLKNRVDGQIQYYQDKHDIAQRDRHRLSKYVTWSMDAAIFVAVAGCILVFADASERLLRLSGAGLILGLVGCLLPLVAVLTQKLGAFLELDRRTGKYAQQEQVLQHLRAKLLKVETLGEALPIIQEIEQKLIGEVVDWFYEVRNSEVYYRLSKKVQATVTRHRFTSERWLNKLSAPFVFLFKLVFDRMLVVAASFILTTAGIAYMTPEDTEQLSTMRLIDGRLLSSPSAKGWFVNDKTRNGVIFIAHGLHDGVQVKPSRGEELHWMSEMQNRLAERTAENGPDIVLIDWKQMAQPSRTSLLGARLREYLSSNYSLIEMLQDVSAIRPSAEELGELVGFKIARKITRGEIDRDQPIHFIGHSAGGFLVTRAAQVLHDLGLADNITITILDTPVAVTEDLLNAARFARVDFYVTSFFAAGVPGSELHENYTRFEVATPPEIDKFIQAHSYITDWYIDSIKDKSLPGFERSPFANRD